MTFLLVLDMHKFKKAKEKNLRDWLFEVVYRKEVEGQSFLRLFISYKNINI